MMMRLCVLLGMALLLPFAVNAVAEEEAAPALRVLSYNVRYHNLSDGLNAWPMRRDRVAQVFSDEKIDVAGLQEVTSRQIDDLEERLKDDYAWVGAGRDDGKRKGEFVPIFYRKERFELVDSGHFWLCEEPETPGRIDWNAACARMATWVKLRDLQTEREFVFCNTHLDHVSGEAREKGSRLILERLQAHGELPLLLAGDFNAGTGSEVYRLVTAGIEREGAANGEKFALADAMTQSAAPHEGPDSTWNGFKEIAPRARIDFIFTRGPWKVRRHAILDPRVGDSERFASDHLPVLAEAALE